MSADAPQDVWATSRDGTRIHAYEWGLPGSNRPTLLFVPGGTGNAWSAESIAEGARAGQLGPPRRVIGISRRGMGLSAAPAAGYGPAQFADDVEAVVISARLERFVLFGHSMGVPISLELAVRAPAGLAALILGDAPAAYIDFAAAGTFDSVLSSPFVFASWDEAFVKIGLGDRPRFDAICHRYLRETGDGQVALLIDRAALERTREESRRAHTDYWERLGEIRVPTLLLRATTGWSPLADADVRRYAECLRQLRVQSLPTGHDLGLNNERAPLFAALARFLTEIDSASGSSPSSSPPTA